MTRKFQTSDAATTVSARPRSRARTATARAANAANAESVNSSANFIGRVYIPASPSNREGARCRAPSAFGSSGQAEEIEAVGRGDEVFDHARDRKDQPIVEPHAAFAHGAPLQEASHEEPAGRADQVSVLEHGDLE